MFERTIRNTRAVPKGIYVKYFLQFPPDNSIFIITLIFVCSTTPENVKVTRSDIYSESLAHGLMLRRSYVMFQARTLQMTNLCNHKVVNNICGPTCVHTRRIDNNLHFPHDFEIEIAIVIFLSEIIPLCYMTRKNIFKTNPPTVYLYRFSVVQVQFQERPPFKPTQVHFYSLDHQGRFDFYGNVACNS